MLIRVLTANYRLLLLADTKPKIEPLCEENLEDEEITFHFKKKIGDVGVKKEENLKKSEFEWLKTMVIFYHDWFLFDIKTEKKDDYEENVIMPRFPKKRKRRKRRSY